MNPLSTDSTTGDNDPMRLHRTAEGLELHVQAQPGSRRNGITGFHQGHWKVAVSQIAEKGKANVAVANVLAKELRLKPRQLQLIGPALNPFKRFRITGITEDELRLRLQDLEKKLFFDLETQSGRINLLVRVALNRGGSWRILPLVLEDRRRNPRQTQGISFIVCLPPDSTTREG